MDLLETRKELDLQLSKPYIKMVNSVYGFRFVKIIIGHGNKEYWVYMGPRSDYLIIPRTFCSCKDFIIRVIALKQTHFCKHLMGVEMAIRMKKFRVIEMKIEDLMKIINEIMKSGFSTTLRRKMYIS
ncbi:MAG: SWIM zinc finger family protein [Desulfurococcaceae archaeon]